MSGAYNPNQKVQKVMVQPINLIFRYLQNRTLVSVWLYENVNTRIEGRIVGFDEYMNLVLDDAAEVHLKRRTRKEVREPDWAQSTGLSSPLFPRFGLPKGASTYIGTSSTTTKCQHVRYRVFQ